MKISCWVKKTESNLYKYINNYKDYFRRNNEIKKECKTQLDPIPRLILLPNIGLIGVGKNKNAAK